VLLLLNSCSNVSKRTFYCECDKARIKIETECKSEKSNGDFESTIRFLDELDSRGCECEEGEPDLLEGVKLR